MRQQIPMTEPIAEPVPRARPALQSRRGRVAAIVDAGDARPLRDTIERLADTRFDALMCAYEWSSRLRPSLGDGVGPLGQPTEETVAELGWQSLRFPIACPQPDDGTMFYLVIDLKQLSYGRLCLDIELTEDSLVEVGYATDRTLYGQVVPRTAERLTLGAGIHQRDLADRHQARYILLHLSSGATLHELAWETFSYPYTLERRFETSDATLAAIWRTAESTMRQGGVESRTPTPSLTAGYALFGDLERLAWGLQDWLEALVTKAPPARHPRRVLEAVYYVWRSADADLAPALLEGCLQVLYGCLEDQTDGIWACESEWLSASTRDNLELLQAYYATAWLQTFLDQDDAGFLTSNAGVALIGSMRAALWDQQRGAYAMGLDLAGNRVPYCSQPENALAVSIPAMNPYEMERAHEFCAGESGIWPTNRSSWQGREPQRQAHGAPEVAVVAATPRDLLDCARAIAQLESPQAAVDYLRFHFGAMVDEGSGVFTDRIGNPAFALGGGLVDSSAAMVADVILEVALGVTITAAGGSVLDWRPWQVRVERLRGKIRTRHGDVLLGWHGEELIWTVPEGVRVELTAPDRSRHVITGPRSSFPKEDVDESEPPDRLADASGAPPLADAEP